MDVTQNLGALSKNTKIYVLKVIAADYYSVSLLMVAALVYSLEKGQIWSDWTRL